MNHTSSILRPALAALHPEAPITSSGLTILPFTTKYRGGTRYVLLQKALARGRLTITEVSDGGSVPYLKAFNKGPWPVLIFDGEELVGAKQNRIANTTILIGVGESILPVSCVEEGRWSLRSRAFSSGTYASHPGLRRAKQVQVGKSLEEAERRHSQGTLSQAERAGCYRADQHAVWAAVHECSAAVGVTSQTGAMADAYRERAGDLEAAMAAFMRPRGAQGDDRTERTVPVDGVVAVAVFQGARFLCFDALWPAKRFAEIYPKLLRGYALEALNACAGIGERPADPEAEVLRLFAELADVEPDERPGADLGRDIRVETRRALGAGLVWEDSLLQVSVFAR